MNTKFKSIHLLQAIIAVALLQPNLAQAHFLWLERAGAQTKLFFGEYEGGLIEKAGGRLDTIAAPVAQVLGKPGEVLPLKRADDHIVINGAAGQPVIATELSLPVQDLSANYFGIVKPMYYTRLGSGTPEAGSNLALDIQPIGATKVRVLLNGAPLPKGKVFVIAPNHWMQELDIGAGGEVSFKMPWPGVYVLKVVHLEAKPGTFQNVTYQNVRHVSTLSLVNK